MSPFAPHLLHQAFFGGVAAAGFAVLFNCPPRLLWIAFGAGALALAVRTGGQETGGLSLPAASFIAAFVLALLNRILEPPDSPRGSVLAVVGCIPMIPGSLAAKGLMNLFELLKGESWRGASGGHSRRRESDARGVYPSRSRNSAGNSTPSVPSRAKAKQ